MKRITNSALKTSLYSDAIVGRDLPRHPNHSAPANGYFMGAGITTVVERARKEHE
jgi:hypothetical protein